ncbi:MAG: response regulator transcription factor [Nitrospira sp.]|nr:response regulator transcription factor [bacterium]MBL7048483.1 response regulator transcription factor [Nitrospira sp.]
MSIKLVIGCSNYILSEGIKTLLQGQIDISVIGIFDEGLDIEDISRLNPDIIITDINVFHGIAEHITLDSPFKILLLSIRNWIPRDESIHIKRLLTKGIIGILPPGSDAVMLIKAITATFSGELWVSRNMLQSLLSNELGQVQGQVRFTSRENEVLQLICKGYRNKEIAQQLGIEEQTVKSHCNRLYKKAGVSDRLQLALYTYRQCPELAREG